MSNNYALAINPTRTLILIPAGDDRGFSIGNVMEKTAFEAWKKFKTDPSAANMGEVLQDVIKSVRLGPSLKDYVVKPVYRSEVSLLPAGSTYDEEGSPRNMSGIYSFGHLFTLQNAGEGKIEVRIHGSKEEYLTLDLEGVVWRFHDMYGNVFEPVRLAKELGMQEPVAA